MTVVVVYESVYGNTHQVAEAIARGLDEAGASAEVVPVEEARQWQWDPEDVLVVRGPRPARNDHCEPWSADLLATSSWRNP